MGLLDIPLKPLATANRAKNTNFTMRSSTSRNAVTEEMPPATPLADHLYRTAMKASVAAASRGGLITVNQTFGTPRKAGYRPCGVGPRDRRHLRGRGQLLIVIAHSCVEERL